MIQLNIKKIMYDDTSVITGDLDLAAAKALLVTNEASHKLIPNVHQETWNVEESDPSKTGYTDQLTGMEYYSDVTGGGAITVSFAVGQYDYETKQSLMGGNLIKKGGDGTDKDTVVGYSRPRGVNKQYKTLMCLTADDVWIVYPKCLIVSNTKLQDKAIKLNTQAFVQLPDIAAVMPEYNFNAEELK